MTEGVLNMGAVLRELDFGNGKTSVLFENGVQVLYDHGKYVDDVPGSWGEREINAWFEGIEKGKEAGTAIIAKLEAELEQVKWERDAAVECIERIDKMIGYAYVNEIVDCIDKWRGVKERS